VDQVNSLTLFWGGQQFIPVRRGEEEKGKKPRIAELSVSGLRELREDHIRDVMALVTRRSLKIVCDGWNTSSESHSTSSFLN